MSVSLVLEEAAPDVPAGMAHEDEYAGQATVGFLRGFAAR
jgi:hypothetical protein